MKEEKEMQGKLKRVKQQRQTDEELEEEEGESVNEGRKWDVLIK